MERREPGPAVPSEDDGARLDAAGTPVSAGGPPGDGLADRHQRDDQADQRGRDVQDVVRGVDVEEVPRLAEAIRP